MDGAGASLLLLLQPVGIPSSSRIAFWVSTGLFALRGELGEEDLLPDGLRGTPDGEGGERADEDAADHDIDEGVCPSDSRTSRRSRTGDRAPGLRAADRRAGAGMIGEAEPGALLALRRVGGELFSATVIGVGHGAQA